MFSSITLLCQTACLATPPADLIVLHAASKSNTSSGPVPIKLFSVCTPPRTPLVSASWTPRPRNHAACCLRLSLRPFTHLHDMTQHCRGALLPKGLCRCDSPQHSQKASCPDSTHPATFAGPQAHDRVLLLPQLTVLGKQHVPAARWAVGRVASLDQLHCSRDTRLCN